VRCRLLQAAARHRRNCSGNKRRADVMPLNVTAYEPLTNGSVVASTSLDLRDCDLLTGQINLQ